LKEERKILKVVEKENRKFTAVDAVSYTTLFNTIHEVSMPVLKRRKCPVWNDFQFCLTARQADRVKGKITPVSKGSSSDLHF